MARKIRLYGLTALLNASNSCDLCICTPAKLSSMKWRPGSSSQVIGAGDYDGVVTEYDLETGTAVFERDEHAGKRVWSLDYSHFFSSNVGVSGSDDGSAQVWDARGESGKIVAVARPGVASVCCVEFDPFDAPYLAVGSADRKGYIYDLRKIVEPVSILAGHTKTVSYIRFLESNCVVTAGTDGCLKLWDLSHSSVERTYSGHMNQRNFVGLSVWRKGGLLACGSENNSVFVYDRRWSEPKWISQMQWPSDPSMPVVRPGFVSSVCWMQEKEEQCTLMAVGSDGVLQVILGNRIS